MTEEDAKILTRLRLAIAASYGDRLRKVVLFGSRARGDHHAHSDYDVAVALDQIDDRGCYHPVLDINKAIKPEAAARTLALATLLIEQITMAPAKTPQTD